MFLFSQGGEEEDILSEKVAPFFHLILSYSLIGELCPSITTSDVFTFSVTVNNSFSFVSDAKKPSL